MNRIRNVFTNFILIAKCDILVAIEELTRKQNLKINKCKTKG